MQKISYCQRILITQQKLRILYGKLDGVSIVWYTVEPAKEVTKQDDVYQAGFREVVYSWIRTRSLGYTSIYLLPAAQMTPALQSALFIDKSLSIRPSKKLLDVWKPVGLHTETGLRLLIVHAYRLAFSSTESSNPLGIPQKI